MSCYMPTLFLLFFAFAGGVLFAAWRSERRLRKGQPRSDERE